MDVLVHFSKRDKEEHESPGTKNSFITHALSTTGIWQEFALPVAYIVLKID